jgi:cysteinyl-tRNA synthetase
MVTMISALVSKGSAYSINDSVYFEVSKAARQEDAIPRRSEMNMRTRAPLKCPSRALDSWVGAGTAAWLA